MTSFAGMVLATLGYITPILAIVVMILSIFAILLNTLRIRGIKIREEDEAESPVGSLADIEFAVPKMHCGGCAEKITTSLALVKGIREVKPKVAQKRLYVQYVPEEIDQESLEQILDKAGFTAIAT